MDWISIVVLVFFLVFAAVCVLITLVGLPGTWIMVLTALVVELSDSLWSDEDMWGWTVIGICFGLAVFGEILELASSGLGSKVGGGTRRGMIGAIIGSVVGGIVMTFVLPIPLVGTLVGAVAGAFAGAVIGELSHEHPQEFGHIAKTATGATIGRVLGILGKTGVAAVCWCVFVVSVLL